MEPVECRSLDEALKLSVNRTDVDCVVLDIREQESGAASFSKLFPRPAGTARSVPVVQVLMSGRAALDLPGIACSTLTLPIKPGRLKSALRQILHKEPMNPEPWKERERMFDENMAERNPLRILVAEDNLINQKVIVKMLEKLGYKANVANNGQEAVDAVAGKNYDVVLMDVQMPVLNGIDATRRIISSTASEARPRIIGLTANATQEDRQVCIDAGMEDFLPKPVTAVLLAETLSAAYQARSTQS
jgi:CheY-like chemotaxis protein